MHLRQGFLFMSLFSYGTLNGSQVWHSSISLLFRGVYNYCIDSQILSIVFRSTILTFAIRDLFIGVNGAMAPPILAIT